MIGVVSHTYSYKGNNEVVMMLFESPIRTKVVRNGIVARQYINGTVNINGETYIGWSLSDAIAMYRKKFPVRMYQLV